MNGKDKCKLLKEIREEIARENDIEFESEECTFEGDCSGTCPKCEEELRYLENEIDKKEGKIKDIFKSGKSKVKELFKQGEIHVKFKKNTDEIVELDGMPPLDFDEPLEGLPADEHEILEEQIVEISDSDESDEIPTIYVDTGLPADNEILCRKSDIYKFRR